MEEIQKSQVMDDDCSAPIELEEEKAENKPPSSRVSRKRTKTGCLTCRRRRIKCGEERPRCANCIKSKRSCEGYSQRVVFKDPLSASRFPSSFTPSEHPTKRRLPSTTQSASNPTNHVPPPQNPSNRKNFLLNQHVGPSSSTTSQENTQSESQRNNSPSRYSDIEWRAHTRQSDSGPAVDLDYKAPVKITSSSEISPISDEIPANLKLYQNVAVDFKSGDQDIVGNYRNQFRKHALFSENGLPRSRQGSLSVLIEDNADEDRNMDQIENDNDPYDVSDDDLQDNHETALTDSYEDGRLKNNDYGIVVALQAAQDRHGQSLRTYHSFIKGYDSDVLASYRPSGQSSPLNDSVAARMFCHFINVTAPCISMYERHPANPSLIFQGHPVPKSHRHLWTYTMPTIALGNPALLHAMLALGSLHVAKLLNGPVTAPLKHYHLAIRRVGKAVSLPSHREQPATLAATMLLSFFEVMNADHRKWADHLLGAKILLQGINFSGIARYLKKKSRQEREIRFRQGRDSIKRPIPIDASHDRESRVEWDLAKDDIDERLVSVLTGKRLQYDNFGQVVEGTSTSEIDDKTYTQKEIETYETQRDMFWWFCKMDAFQSILGGTKLMMPYDTWSFCPPRAPIGRRDAIYGTWDHLLLLLGRVADFSAQDLKRKRKEMESSKRRPAENEALRNRFRNSEKSKDVPMRNSPTQNSSGEVGVQEDCEIEVAQIGNLEYTLASGDQSHSLNSFQSHQHQHPVTLTRAEIFSRQRGDQRRADLPSSENLPVSPQIMVPFPGMLPGAVGRRNLPRGFDQVDAPKETPETVDPRTLDDQGKEAESEWQEILTAFGIFRDSLGHDYEPLGPEYTPSIATPFGPALQYRTFGIAGIWMSYYLGLIVLHRAHPSMPPAAMMAVGAAARQTAAYANKIGQIAAAIAPNAAKVDQINTGVGAALIESSFSLFVAGVQYQSAAQRTWIIQRCFDMRRLTGWQTAHSIALGCETSWVKAAEAGRGAPYSRELDLRTQMGAALEAVEEQSKRESVDDASGPSKDSQAFARDARNRLQFALGLLAVEQDMQHIHIRNGRSSHE